MGHENFAVFHQEDLAFVKSLLVLFGLDVLLDFDQDLFCLLIHILDIN